jgi:hypothetical protein
MAAYSNFLAYDISPSLHAYPHPPSLIYILPLSLIIIIIILPLSLSPVDAHDEGG